MSAGISTQNNTAAQGGQTENLAGMQSVFIEHPDSNSPYILVCDHASNRMPESYNNLGLEPALLNEHIAWDIRALDLARAISALLHCPVVSPGFSRLLIDCNRSLDAPDLIPVKSEKYAIPGNNNLTADEKKYRIESYYLPYHQAIASLVENRTMNKIPTALIGVHTFTPVFLGISRPWQIGIIHDEDKRIAGPLYQELRQLPDIVVGENEPYKPADGVYYTLSAHTQKFNLPGVMIEVRNNEVSSPSMLRKWASIIATTLTKTTEWKNQSHE